MSRKPAPSAPPVAVIFGEDDHRRRAALRSLLDRLLPPEADRGMALVELDGTKSEEQGGPSFAAVADDLGTLPFLAERRVVLIRDADKFVSATRAKLEAYVERPSPTGTLILVCASFPKTTRLYKAVAAKGELIDCPRPTQRQLLEICEEQARAAGKRLDPGVAELLVEQVGPDAAILATEIDKLALYAGDRPVITEEDIRRLVGVSREEVIFAALDDAVCGRVGAALAAWRQVLQTDPDAIYRAVGGVAWGLRRFLTVAALGEQGLSPRDIAVQVRMFGKEQQVREILRRLPAVRLRRALAALADADAKAKVGLRSIESGVERILVGLAGGKQ